MKQFNYFWFIILITVTGTAWSYGGGGSSSTKACAKPKFSSFTPIENGEIKAGEPFSFIASKNTYPNSIKVLIKELSVAIKVAPKNDGSFQVSGVLPKSLKGPYARIAIAADAQSNCNGTGGWLVKVTP